MAERDEARLLARIEAGERIESPDEMTEAYRENLIHLMTMQADSELAGGYGYVPWITRAPGVEEKHVVAQIVKDELRHATVMYGLLADLGVDVDAHVRAHDEAFTMRVANDADIGTARITADKRVNIFYYPIDTWADFTFFNFCMDRGAGHQLEDVRTCSYGPWVRAIEGIFKEEKFHIRHGEFWVKRLAEDPEDARRGPGHAQQVVHPHHEHLRAPRLAQERALPEVPAQAARQRRGAPDLRPRGRGEGGRGRAHAARVEPGLGPPARRGADPRVIRGAPALGRLAWR